VSEKSFNLNNTVEITNHVHLPNTNKHIADNLHYIFHTMGIKKISNNKGDLQTNTRSQLLMLFESHDCSSPSCTIFSYFHLFLKIEKVMWPW